MNVEQSLAAEIDAAAEAAVASLHEQSAMERGETVEDGETEGENREARDDSGGAEEGGRLDSDSRKGGDVLPEGEGGREERAGGDGDSEGDGGDSERQVAPQISDEALTRAILAGIPLSEARAFPSEESLLRVADAVLKASAEPGQEADEEVADPFADFPELDPEEYGPNVIKAFEAMKSALKAQNETINEFRRQQAESVEAAQVAASRDVEQWFDRQVEGLGEDFAEVLGTGGFSSLEPGSSQRAKRDQIASRMAITLAGYQATGQVAPPREEVFQEAARIVLQQEFAEARERKLSKDLEKRAGQHIARPGGKKTKNTQNPLEETADLLDRKYFSK